MTARMYEGIDIFTVQIITVKSQNKSIISINLRVDEIRLRVMVYDGSRILVGSRLKQDAVNRHETCGTAHSSDSRFINDTIAALLMSQ